MSFKKYTGLVGLLLLLGMNLARVAAQGAPADITLSLPEGARVRVECPMTLSLDAGYLTCAAAATPTDTATSTPPRTSTPPPTHTATPMATPTATTSPTPSLYLTIILAAGDIAGCGRTSDEQTAALLAAEPSATVLTIGDNVYPDGTATEFANCYAPSWGQFKARTHPSPGNHDYNTSDAAGYFGYFGVPSYYSFDVGAWHIVSLNSEVSHGAGSTQEQWLRADLAANSTACTLAYWHRPLFSSGQHGNNLDMAALWQALADYGADVVLAGHDHLYERFAPQNASGVADPNGVRQFTVGTGGATLYGWSTVKPNSEVRYNASHGVLRLALAETGYTWQFITVAGGVADSGTDVCTSPTVQTATPTATATTTEAAPMSIALETGTQTNTFGTATTDYLITKPTGTASGELLVAFLSMNNNPTVTPPSGWVSIGRATLSGATGEAFYKVAGDSEPADYTFTLSFAATGSIIAARFSGQNATVPDVSASTNTGTGTTATGLSITTVTDGAMLIAFVSVDSTTAPTLPSGMTDIGSTAAGKALRVAYETRASAGATGDRTSTTTNNAWGAILWAIRPAAAAPPVVTEQIERRLRIRRTQMVIQHKPNRAV